MSWFKSPFLWFLLLLLALAVLTILGPEEELLGQQLRIANLHGTWMLTALVTLIASGCLGLVGLLTRREGAHDWSRALGRSAIIFWVTYLPLSLWALQATWSGLCQEEPLFRVAVIVAGVGVLLQFGLAIINHRNLTSVTNLLFSAALIWALSQAASLKISPPSAILTSGTTSMNMFFIVENMVGLLAAFMLTRWWLGK